MATRGDLINRILGELHLENTSYTAQVEDAITSAVDFYRPERFWFNEGTTEFALATAGTATLASELPESIILDTVRVKDDSGNYSPPMTSLAWDEYQDKVTMTAQPTHWALHHRLLHFWPTNNKTRTVEVTWSGRVTMTASNSSSCVWTNEAEELIRTHAKVDLCENFLLDFPQADRLRGREGQIFSQLISETIKRLNLGRNMRPVL